MARKADIRICRFAECAHTGKIIDISEDNYFADGKAYYHKECFEAKEQKIIDERIAKEKEIAERRSEKEREIANKRLQKEHEAEQRRKEKELEKESRRLQKEREAEQKRIEKEQAKDQKRLEKEQEAAAQRLARSKLKKCSYRNCNHSSKTIDTACEEYQLRKGKYYHPDCLISFEKNIDKETIISADIQLIKNMWIADISDTVVIPCLYAELNKLIADRGISSKYVVFVVDYCIKNKCNLRYPGGLKYYVDRQEIKNAYEKEQAKEIVKKAEFIADISAEDTSPKFSINKKPTGFSSILSRRK